LTENPTRRPEFPGFGRFADHAVRVKILARVLLYIRATRNPLGTETGIPRARETEPTRGGMVEPMIKELQLFAHGEEERQGDVLHSLPCVRLAESGLSAVKRDSLEKGERRHGMSEKKMTDEELAKISGAGEKSTTKPGEPSLPDAGGSGGGADDDVVSTDGPGGDTQDFART